MASWKADDAFAVVLANACQLVELDVGVFVVVLRGGLVISASLHAEDYFFTQHLQPHLGEAVGGLDVIAVFVLVMKQRVGNRRSRLRRSLKAALARLL